MADGSREAEQDTVGIADVEVMAVDGPRASNGNGSGHAGDGESPCAAEPESATEPEPDTIEVVIGEVEDPPMTDAAAPSAVAVEPEPLVPDAECVEAALDGEEVGFDESELRVDEADDLDDELTAADFGGSDEAIALSAEDKLVEALPDLARLAAVAWTRTAAWGFGAGLRVGARLARATVDPQTAAELAQGMGSGMRSYARELLGITDLEDRLDALTPAGGRFAGPRGELYRGESREPRVSPEAQLRAQGAELLRQSADVTVDDRLHPAFGRILGELAPDEGRILRLLAQEGPQPVVDVRAANLIGMGSQLVAQNLNMVHMRAGTRHAERVPAYLINLQRLGLASFADEPLDDAITYQVLEAQPYVLEAIQATSRAKTVQRSLRLTPFGAQFCEACLVPAPAQELPSGEAIESDDQ